MALNIIEIHPADGPELLNSEWFVLENAGDKAFSTKNCTLFAQKGAKKAAVGTIDPGFSIGPGERVRVVTGNPGKKVHGVMPSGEPRSYSLFLASSILRGPGTVLTLTLRSLALATAEYAPDATAGVAPPAA